MEGVINVKRKTDLQVNRPWLCVALAVVAYRRKGRKSV